MKLNELNFFSNTEELMTVKFPHSPILHYAFSSWREKTMQKQYIALGKQICFTIGWECAEILP